MTQVKELTAEEAIEESIPMWRQERERALAQRLLYYALTKDENCQKALFTLAKRAELMVDQDIALTLIEYTLSSVSDNSLKERILRERHFLLRQLDLLTNTDSDYYAQLPIEKWSDPAEFSFDRDRFDAIINSVVGTTNLRAVFLAMRTYIGFCSGFLTANSNSESISFSDCFHPENFTESGKYQEFLTMENFDSKYLNSLKFPGPD
jgi:hypothetical protein